MNTVLTRSASTPMETTPPTETEEPTSLAGIPVSELAKHCHDPAVLRIVIKAAHNLGYRRGQEATHTHYHTMMSGVRAIYLRGERKADNNN